MRKVVLLLIMCFVGFAGADTLRYRGSGPWKDLDDGTHGWISPDAPDATDTVRANWGGATITLDYETTIGKFQAGVDESGTFHILSGGILNTAIGNNKIGNNNACTGTMIIDAGGTVNSTGWLMIAGSTLVTGVAEVSGTLNSASHLWMATGAGSTATLDINGGIVNVGGMIGLGTVNAVDASGGTATINVNDGGILNLSNIHGGIRNDPVTGNSIQPGSLITLNGSGIITLPGDFEAVIAAYVARGSITSDLGGVGTDLTMNPGFTTVFAVPEPAAMLLLGLGGLLVRKRR